MSRAQAARCRAPSASRSSARADGSPTAANKGGHRAASVLRATLTTHSPNCTRSHVAGWAMRKHACALAELAWQPAQFVCPACMQLIALQQALHPQGRCIDTDWGFKGSWPAIAVHLCMEAVECQAQHSAVAARGASRGSCSIPAGRSV